MRRPRIGGIKGFLTSFAWRKATEEKEEEDEEGRGTVSQISDKLDIILGGRAVPFRPKSPT